MSHLIDTELMRITSVMLFAGCVLPAPTSSLLPLHGSSADVPVLFFAGAGLADVHSVRHSAAPGGDKEVSDGVAVGACGVTQMLHVYVPLCSTQLCDCAGSLAFSEIQHGAGRPFVRRRPSTRPAFYSAGK